jgi:hypothetical protein
MHWANYRHCLQTVFNPIFIGSLHRLRPVQGPYTVRSLGQLIHLPGNPYGRGQNITVNLLVLTSTESDQLH